MKVARGELVTISSNMKQFVVARTDGITVMDFWNSADPSERIGLDGEVGCANITKKNGKIKN